MIATVDIAVQAKFPNMPLTPMFAYVNSPSSIRLRNVPKKIGNWQINQVTFFVAYPDNTTKSVGCVLVGGMWVGTVEGSTRAGKSINGYTIFASGVDENGYPVENYVLGKGDVTILQADGTIDPEDTTYYVHLLSAQSDEPKEGDLWQNDGTYYIWQNGQAWPIGDDSGLIDELSAKIENKADLSALDEKADLSTLSDYAPISALDAKADISALDDKADLSVLDSKRGIYDLELYPLSVLTTPYYLATVKDIDTHVNITEVALQKIGSSYFTWKWQLDGQSILLSTTSEPDSWRLIYQNLENSMQQPSSGSFSNFSISSTTQVVTLADSNFLFEIKAYGGMIATQQWVQTQDYATEAYVDTNTKYNLTSSGSSILSNNTVQLKTLVELTTQFELPALLDGKVNDFVLDVKNNYVDPEEFLPAQASFTLSGTLGTDYYILVPDGEDFAEMTTLEAGELAEYYFTRTAFQLDNSDTSKPAWKVVKQKVTNYTLPTI